METLISVDPGVCSGIAVFKYDRLSAAELVHVDQFRGGTEELLDRLDEIVNRASSWRFVCEDFQARPQKGFGYTTKSLEPLVAIGALVARGWIDRRSRKDMATPSFQYFAGDKSKSAQHQWLKEQGMHYTNKDFPDSDKNDGADDARSAMAHGIAWFKRQKHLPTIRKYFPPSD